jgi:hypothetical protein
MAMASTTRSPDLDATIDRIARHRFRAKFHLRARERAYVELRGMETVRAHAHDFIGKRLAPARPHNDGKQTPWGGHPVFRAQHATATCCRSCLLKAHEIAMGRDLSAEEQDYVVDVICRWVERESAAAGRTPSA